MINEPKPQSLIIYPLSLFIKTNAPSHRIKVSELSPENFKENEQTSEFLQETPEILRTNLKFLRTYFKIRTEKLAKTHGVFLIRSC